MHRRLVLIQFFVTTDAVVAPRDLDDRQEVVAEWSAGAKRGSPSWLRARGGDARAQVGRRPGCSTSAFCGARAAKGERRTSGCGAAPGERQVDGDQVGDELLRIGGHRAGETNVSPSRSPAPGSGSESARGRAFRPGAARSVGTPRAGGERRLRFGGNDARGEVFLQQLEDSRAASSTGLRRPAAATPACSSSSAGCAARSSAVVRTRTRALSRRPPKSHCASVGEGGRNSRQQRAAPQELRSAAASHAAGSAGDRGR